MSIKTEIQNQIKLQIRNQIAERQPKQKTFGKFITNLKEDVTSFGKGLLGLGRKAVTEPIQSAKAVGGAVADVAGFAAKGVPEFGKQAFDIIINPIENIKKVKQGYQELRAIPYEEQKKIIEETKSSVLKTAQEKGKTIPVALGLGLGADIIQEITHPAEFAYEKPFTFGLDALSVGGGKVITKGTKLAAQPLSKTKLAESLGDLFIPNAALKKAGYSEFANDITKTNEKIFNAQSGIIKSTAKKFEKDFSLTKAERFEFFDTVDTLRRTEKGIKAVSENPKIQSAISWWLDQEVPKLQKVVKLPEEKAITNYLHHFFPEKTTQAEKGLRPFKIIEGFLKKSQDVAGFSKDPIVSISAIKSKIATNAIKDSFIQRTVKKYGKSVDEMEAELIARVGSDVVESAKKANNLDSLIKKNLDVDTFSPRVKEKYYLPKAVADEMNKFYSKSTAGDTIKKLLTPLDVFNRNWKPLATAVRPRYHTRNVIGNLYNSIIIGSMNPTNIPKAALQQLGKYINEARLNKGVTGQIARTLFPKKFNTKLLDQALKENVVGRGFFAMDLHDLSNAVDITDDIMKVINKVQNPAEIYRVPILKQYLNLSFHIGQALEDNARLALYIDRVGKGFGKTAAKEYVNKHLFDYLTGLGEADKYIKKIIPFWSWTRFNLPLQSESLFTKPIRQAAIQRTGQPFVESVEKEDESVQFFTEEEISQGLLKVGDVEKGGKILDKYIRTQAVLPQSDIVKIIDMFQFNFQDIGGQPVLELLNRLGKNENFFGRQIERFTGEEFKFLGIPMRGKIKEAAGIIPFLSELNKLIGGSYIEDDKPDLPVRLEQVLSPLGTTLKDPEDIKFFGMLKKEQELKGSYEAGLESLYKRYLIKSNKAPEEKVFKNNIEKLERILKEKGLTDLNLLPIKIKAMKQTIREQITEEVKKQIKK